ncbi:hypothetical protein [Actinoplanes subglobosus]|uniref:TIGR02646 family protein n=1 Tax=Actinoplanes subglobosus TaxID=1547892 RepID=A0ABV8JCD9_9ACTN
MIRVDRARVPAPAILTDAGGKGVREATRARKSLERWVADGKKPEAWTFTFAVYREREIKDALTALFHGKCAYCETRYAATQPMDVEHWRPKAQVQDAAGPPVRPAYHWLAASWSNLLPSCIDCNRRRTHVDVGAGRIHAIGKQDQFPLDPGSARATSAAGIVSEVPLLLDPCADDPETFLDCTEDGLITALATDGLVRRRAEASIQVYALNRNGLVFERKELLRRIRLRIARVAQILQLLDGLPPTDRTALVLDEILAEDMRELARMRRNDQPYSLLARRLIDRWMDQVTTHGAAPGALDPHAAPGRAQ